MSGFWLTPVAPGTIAPAYLAKVHELHLIVRKWIEDSATAQKNEHILATLPYVDLMFAFGFATLGDHASANELVEEARKVMVGAVPEDGNCENAQLTSFSIVKNFLRRAFRDRAKSDLEVAHAIIKNFLFRAFRYRIQEALVGNPLRGRLSSELLTERDEIRQIASSGPVTNPHKLAAYVIDRFRVWSRIVEPQESIDPYEDWTKHCDPLKVQIAKLRTLTNPDTRDVRVRTLFWEGIRGADLAEVQFLVLLEALALDGVSEQLAIELLDWVPGTIRMGDVSDKERPDLLKKQADMLRRAFVLAVKLHDSTRVINLTVTLSSLIESHEQKHWLIHAVVPTALASLTALGLTVEFESVLTALESAALGGTPESEWRQRYWNQPEQWALVLRSLLVLVPGWLALNLQSRVSSIFTLGHTDLLTPGGMTFQPKDYTELACGYVVAFGDGTESGLSAITELFRELHLQKITNTWTTAQYYSRFHLQLVEEAIFAVARFFSENPIPGTVSG